MRCESANYIGARSFMAAKKPDIKLQPTRHCQGNGCLATGCVHIINMSDLCWYRVPERYCSEPQRKLIHFVCGLIVFGKNVASTRQLLLLQINSFGSPGQLSPAMRCICPQQNKINNLRKISRSKAYPEIAKNAEWWKTGQTDVTKTCKMSQASKAE